MKTNSWERARGARTRDETEARVPEVQFLGNGSTSCVPYLFMYFEIPSIHHASETWLAPPSPPPRSALPRQPQPFLRLLSPFLLPPFLTLALPLSWSQSRYSFPSMYIYIYFISLRNYSRNDVRASRTNKLLRSMISARGIASPERVHVGARR